MLSTEDNILSIHEYEIDSFLGIMEILMRKFFYSKTKMKCKMLANFVANKVYLPPSMIHL